MKRLLLIPRVIDVLAIAAILTAAATLTVVLDRSTYDAWRFARAEMGALQARVRAAEGLPSQRDSLQSEIRTLETAAGRATEGLPAAMETFLVLEDLGRLSRECRVSLDHVVPGNIDAGERFATMPVELRVRGSFHRLIRFLARIECGEHPVRVARLSLSRPPEGTDMSLEAGLAVCCLSPGNAASGDATP